MRKVSFAHESLTPHIAQLIIEPVVFAAASLAADTAPANDWPNRNLLSARHPSMDFVFIIGLVLLCIVFLVFVFLSAKTWHWLHVVAVFLAFSMAVTSTVFLSLTTKTVNAWKRVAQENEAKVEDLESKIKLETLGSTDALRYSQASIVNLRNTLERETYGRGRVWRECTPVNIANDWSNVTISTVPFSTTDPAAAPENRIANSTIVYIFTEREYVDENDPNRFVDPNNPNKRFVVPDTYLGEFSVQSSDGQSVQVTPIRFGATSDEYVAAQNQSWVLYELMPVDRRDAFDDLMPMFYEAGGKSPEELSDEQLLERRNRIETLFINAGLPYQPGTAEFEEFIDRYAFDDLSLPRIRKLIGLQNNRVNPNFTPDESETWVRLKFTEDGTHQVDVADEALESSGDSRITGLESGAFDNQGRARVRSLRQDGKDSEYKEGDELVVDIFSGERGYTDQEGTQVAPLITGDAGSSRAEKVTEVYRRSLNDFEYYFHTTDLHLKLLATDLDRILRDQGFIADSLNSASNQQTDWETLVSRFTSDNTNFQGDLETAVSYRESLESDLSRKRELFNRLYGAMLMKAQEKAAVQKKLTEQIEQETANALESLDEG